MNNTTESETNKAKEQKGRFLGALLEMLASSLLGIFLTYKGYI